MNFLFKDSHEQIDPIQIVDFRGKKTFILGSARTGKTVLIKKSVNFYCTHDKVLYFGSELEVNDMQNSFGFRKLMKDSLSLEKNHAYDEKICISPNHLLFPSAKDLDAFIDEYINAGYLIIFDEFVDLEGRNILGTYYKKINSVAKENISASGGIVLVKQSLEVQKGLIECLPFMDDIISFRVHTRGDIDIINQPDIMKLKQGTGVIFSKIKNEDNVWEMSGLIGDDTPEVEKKGLFLWIEKYMHPRLYKLKNLNTPTAKELIQVCQTSSDFLSDNEMRVVKRFLKYFSKQDILWLIDEKILSDTEAFDTKKVTFDDVYPDDKELPYLGIIFKYASDDRKFKLLNIIIEEFHNSVALDIKYSFPSGLEVQVAKKKYKDIVVVFKKEADFYFLNTEHILSVGLENNKILINGADSKFQFSEKDDSADIKILLHCLNDMAIKNLKKMKIKNETSSIEDNIKTKDTSTFNPWVAGGLGFLTGAVLID